MGGKSLYFHLMKNYLLNQSFKRVSFLGAKIPCNYCQSSSNIKSLIDVPTHKRQKPLSRNIKTDEKAYYQRDSNPSRSSKDAIGELVLEMDISKKESQVKTFNHSLASYISVCMYSGFYDMGYNAFDYFRRNKSVNSKGLHLLPLNEVLKGIANKGDIEKMKEVLNIMEESCLEPDFNTFAHCLTCLGRNETTSNITNEIEGIISLMNKHEITFDEILSNSNFPGDALDYCMKAIERMIPDVRNKVKSINPTEDFVFEENRYNNKLLNDLNSSKFTNQVKSPFEEVIPRDKIEEIIQRQLDYESKGCVEVPNINSKTSERYESDVELYKEWNVEWRRALKKRLDDYRVLMKETFSDSKNIQFTYFPYLSVLNDDDILDLLMEEIRCQTLPSYYPQLISSGEMAYIFGHKFYRRFLMRYKEKNRTLLTKAYHKYCHSLMYHSDTDSSSLPRIKWNKILAEEFKKINLKDSPIEWPYTVKISIGQRLFSIICDAVKVWNHTQTPKEGTPAFERNSKSGRFWSSHLLRNVTKSACANVIVISADSMPMVSPPVPWTDFNNGGYITRNLKFIRSLLYEYKQISRIKEGGIKKMYPMLDALTSLGSVPWRVNSDMLDIIIEVFKNGGWSELHICPSPSSMPKALEISDSISEEEHFESRNKHRELYKQSKEMEKRLSILNHLRDSAFWLPYYMDTRGRMRPLSEFVNHVMYTDNLRSILCFAKGKKLGKEGLQWLKLHIVNLTGMMKLSPLEDRLKFCEEIMDEIIDSAKNPLNGNKWWTKSKTPWQTLAACKELVAALESDCPEEFESHIPVHQDGSCNVLQHFSALGRDKLGAEFVNLTPNNIPSDVYSHIARVADKEREEEAKKGHLIAQTLEGLVERSVVKQAVLKFIYGTGILTQRGIFHDPLGVNVFPEELQHEDNASYLLAKVEKEFRSIFTSSLLVKRWLNKVAEGVAQQCFKDVEFETPLGLPIVQNHSLETIKFKGSREVVSSYDSDISRFPDLAKQVRSLPSNVILSLEACHMMMTSLFCQEAGVTFVSVHDCYWTHAATVPIMNKICREQFINLHSQPILENIAEFMINKYSSHPNYENIHTTLITDNTTPASLADTLKTLPPKGDFDLNEVSDSVFFFS